MRDGSLGNTFAPLMLTQLVESTPSFFPPSVLLFLELLGRTPTSLVAFDVDL